MIGGLGDAPTRKAATRRPRRGPLVSVLLPAYRPPLWALERAVGSVLAQSEAGWELCVADDGSKDEELSDYLRGLSRLDRRIRVTVRDDNGGIAAATNSALALSTGEFVAFLDQDDELAPGLSPRLPGPSPPNPTRTSSTPTRKRSTRPASASTRSSSRNGPRTCCSASPTSATSPPSVAPSSSSSAGSGRVRRQPGLRPVAAGHRAGTASRGTSRRALPLAVPRQLGRERRGREAHAYEAGRRAVEDALRRRGEEAEVTNHPRFPGRYHVRRAPRGRPLVSVIVPFRDEPAMLATCATSLRAAPGYDNIELVLVDNGSELPETEALLERLAAEPGVRLLRSPGPFNWAAINNAAARECAGICCCSPTTNRGRVPGWLGAMVGHAQRDEVGAVGARLVYGDGAIQHAGVVIARGDRGPRAPGPARRAPGLQLDGHLHPRLLGGDGRLHDGPP